MEYVENVKIKVDPDLLDLTENSREDGPSGMKKPRLDVGVDLDQLESFIKNELSEIVES